MSHTQLLYRFITCVSLAALVACVGPQETSDNTGANSNTAPETTVEQKQNPPITLSEPLLETEIQTRHQSSTELKPSPAAKAKTPALAKRHRLEDRIIMGNTSAYALSQSTIRPANEGLDRENYAHLESNQVKRAAETPLSTFSIDVDTGSYTNVRRILREGRLPPKDAVRVEEMLNYFDYDYPVEQSDNTPFQVYLEAGPNPWNPDTRLLHVGIKAMDKQAQKLPASNLVFLADVSGSMQSGNKLPLLKNSLKLLTKQLRSEDKISLVVYAGASGVVLEPTSGNNKAAIMQALDQLTASGSTNGAAGIRLAYQMAEKGFVQGGINRILLATDGDFNVGTVNFEILKNLVEGKRKTGISLTTLGFGAGNYNDHLMEQLADAGNGNHAYIDTLNEAQKVLVKQMSSTFNTVAKDVKIQIEFNPQVVAEYRLVGYENRLLNREDFNNDKVDAGEIGAGHTVTALYEIALAGEKGSLIDALRYADKPTNTQHNKELAFVKLRYKPADSDKSLLLSYPLPKTSVKQNLLDTTSQYRFAASVAAFGQLLTGARYTGEFNFQQVLELARKSRGEDMFGYRSEFLTLVDLAQSLAGESVQASKAE